MTPEIFCFLASVWDVSAAKALVASREPNASFAPPAEFPCWAKVDEQRAMSDAIDLSVPIILVRIESSTLPIDGWHRIYKATQTKAGPLPAHLISDAAEVGALRIR
jgi:hypothetical protein